jgi:Outer membrane protein beta-barrel domain
MNRVVTDRAQSNIYVEDCLKTLAVLNVCLILGLGCAAGQDSQQSAQQSPPTAPSTGTSSSAAPPDTSESGRRFTGGVTLSVLGFLPISGKSSTTNNSSTESTQDQTTGASSRFGYGIIGQFRISNHFAVDANILYQRLGYQFTETVTATTTTILNGITTSSTSTTSTHEDTRTALFDIPFMVRYYSSARHPGGPRWFVEGGGAWRVATGIRTSIDTTDASGVNTCCTNAPVKPAHRSGIGMVGGAGIQFIDPLGIHVVPEVRYTRWVNQVFDNATTHTTQNQLEATLSLSF